MTVRSGKDCLDSGIHIQNLIDIGIALSSETDLTRLLEKIVSELRRWTQADGGSLYLREEDALHFAVAQNDTLARLRGCDCQLFKPYRIPINEGSIAGYAALTGTILNIPDVRQLPPEFPYHFNASYDIRFEYQTCSLLVVPLKDHLGEVLGVLELINALNDQGEVIPFDPRYDDIVRSLASQAAVAINNARLIQTIKGLFEALMIYSVSAIDARSPHTAGHSRRVAAYSLALAQAINEAAQGPFAEVNFSEPELEELRFSAWLHDIGKIGVRDCVLDKNQKLALETMNAIRWRFYLAQFQAITPEQQQSLEADYRFLEQLNQLNYLPAEAPERLHGLARQLVRLPSGTTQPLLTEAELSDLLILRGNLTPQEYAEIQSHVLHTINILQKIPFSKHLAQVPRYAAAHHERLDGSGYPFHLTAPDLPLQARILAVTDIFDALTATDRPYRAACTADQACEILRAEAHKGALDKDLVELFISRKIYQQILDKDD
ncbi:MAG: GAF domain-containing protein [Deltaproteobacteria bacterium]|nr:GAF domain-containing protein [Deltaproteobacteria bacterium]MBW1951733.1 GAF domain-containing protein [Deltaproteobacteria bacterium]MBW1987245.1 GAF domain-containing protein [Deltaproteobacteria bacterium]MBW2134746.1 GAF domain-containing protein [Deltaproteobacteria bacterium]